MTTAKRLESNERKSKEWFERKHKLINGVDHKFCNNHNSLFPEEDPWLPATLEYFYNSKQSPDGLNTWCKKCAIIKGGIIFQANKERSYASHRKYESTAKWKEYSKRNQIQSKGNRTKWRKDHPEKCIEYSSHHRNHDITEAEWRKELEVFNHECAYCGMAEDESKRTQNQILHREHVDTDGYNDLRNAIPSCRSCNSSKHEDDFEEWYMEQKFFTKERYNKIIWWIEEGYKDYIEDKQPYRIIKKKNEDNNKFHHELWSIDKMRNTIEYIDRRTTKKEIEKDIENGIIGIPKVVSNNT
ncbi:MAG TPA: HNH endonuclease [Clostridium sp.]|uniref:HNH endonuclease n=1 Tax=Clostridium sp. TaxID=1506 RepID=UPI002F95EE5C